MYYEIYMNPATGKWQIRLLTVYFYLFTRAQVIQTTNTSGDATVEPLSFASYDAANTHAATVGLDKAYTQYERVRQGTGICGSVAPIAQETR